LALIDQRRAEARAMADLRAELTAHCGGAPSAVQRQLIERAVVLNMRLVLMDRASLCDPELSERLSRQYLAWSNAFVRLMAAMGPKSASAPKQGLQSYLAEKYGRVREVAEDGRATRAKGTAPAASGASSPRTGQNRPNGHVMPAAAPARPGGQRRRMAEGGSG
jgi:hypothetical protein